MNDSHEMGFFETQIRGHATSIFAELQDFWVHGHGRFQMESFSLRSTPESALQICSFKTKMNSLIKKIKSDYLK